jgi:small subunit ribosomal protein S33
MAAPARLAALKQLQCSIFQTSYNPTSMRTGAKYLRARLRGPSMAAYYPEILNITEMRKSNRAAQFMVDFAERQRLQDVEDKKARGKGTPTKAKSSGAYRTYLLEYGVLMSTCLQRTAGVPRGSGRFRDTSLYLCNGCSIMALIYLFGPSSCHMCLWTCVRICQVCLPKDYNT